MTKPNTLRRAFATAARIWPDIKITVTSPPLTLAQQVTPTRSKDDLINEMTGDLQRILDYPALGFQIAQPVPDDVMQSFEALKKAGFTQHLPK